MAGDDLPPDDAYGRVTNPHRFAILHDAARGLIDDLVEQFDVQRTDGVDLDPDAARSWPGAPATCLDPGGGESSLTFTFTPFPGLAVSGRSVPFTALPACGCDACDDDPRELIEDLRGLIDWEVASEPWSRVDRAP
jgi:hypothetical protein